MLTHTHIDSSDDLTLDKVGLVGTPYISRLRNSRICSRQPQNDIKHGKPTPTRTHLPGSECWILAQFVHNEPYRTRAQWIANYSMCYFMVDYFVWHTCVCVHACERVCEISNYNLTLLESAKMNLTFNLVITWFMNDGVWFSCMCCFNKTEHDLYCLSCYNLNKNICVASFFPPAHIAHSMLIGRHAMKIVFLVRCSNRPPPHLVKKKTNAF